MNPKNKDTFFSSTFKVWESKVSLDFKFMVQGPRYWHFLPQGVGVFFCRYCSAKQFTTIGFPLFWPTLIHEFFNFRDKMSIFKNACRRYIDRKEVELVHLKNELFKITKEKSQECQGNIPPMLGRKYFIFQVNTWANLPYTEVGKSGHRTADLGSSNHTFFRGLELPTLAVLWPHCRTSDLGSFMATFY